MAIVLIGGTPAHGAPVGNHCSIVKNCGSLYVVTHLSFAEDVMNCCHNEHICHGQWKTATRKSHFPELLCFSICSLGSSINDVTQFGQFWTLPPPIVMLSK